MTRLHAAFCLTILVLTIIGCNFTTSDARNNTALNSNTQNTKSHRTEPRSSEIPSAEEIRNRVIHAESIVKVWVENAQLVAEQTNDEFAYRAVEVMDNRCYAIPTQYKGEAVGMIVAEPPTPNAKFVCFLVVEQADLDHMSAWKKKLQGEQFLVSFMDLTIAINGDLSAKFKNPYIRGIALLHEMMQWQQSQIGTPSPDNTGLQMLRYDYEFSLIDRLGLDGYEQFLKQEIPKADSLTRESYINDPRIKKMFGTTASPEETSLISTIMFMRVMFKKFDSSPVTAFLNKSRLLERP